MSEYFVARSVSSLDTPALTVDLDLLEGNIQKASEFFSGLEVGWRPHTKGQKVPAIVHREIEAGAIGITCAKLGEAEVMAAAGVNDILIANQIVGETKARRLANLCRRVDVTVAVDSRKNARQLSEAAREKGVQIPVVVEVDVGMERCGTQPGQPTVDLSRDIYNSEGLDYRGVMAWEGHARRYKGPDERKQVCRKAIDLLVDTARCCREAGLSVDVVSCGGTGTHEFASKISGITEVQAGGIIFNDMYYAGLGLEYDFALTVQSTVTSRPHQRRIVTDAGKKTMSSDTAVPKPLGVGKVESVSLSAEHGVISLAEENDEIEVGDRLEWIVGYSDTTVNLHDEMFGVRDGTVEVVWSVLGRGKIR